MTTATRATDLPEASDGLPLRVAHVEIRPREGMAMVGDRAVALSVREFSLLTALARRAGHVIAREELFSTVWGGSLRRGDRSIDVYVHKLRQKLEAASPGWTFIHTHVGFGYRFAPEPAV
ncbi:response regulator transcription factor [Patulibacter brassicae]|jgi:DNA-binding response OmpR family regulator|uniref:Response regulator transcription factor n=1 Tax=Patulibacter brassicae TaxID=1705717 RepID=A0ABU4VRC3_9ACTN|nr:response regulator transcription factor [Patulibacter brassicae]MDX8153453.1 response regulator transcription factor [Patulibacter brassicae]